MKKKGITIYGVQAMHVSEVTFIGDGIKAGFPSPATDYLQEGINMNRVIVQKPDNTFIIIAEKGISNEECIEEGKPFGNRAVVDST